MTEYVLATLLGISAIVNIGLLERYFYLKNLNSSYSDLADTYRKWYLNYSGKYWKLLGKLQDAVVEDEENDE